MNSNKKTSKELWALVTIGGDIAYSRGGSSSPSRLMVYESEKKALSALNNDWTKQVWADGELTVVQIYKSK